MHSDVYAYLQQVGALTFSTSSLATGGEIVWGGGGVGLNSVEVARFMGLRLCKMTCWPRPSMMLVLTSIPSI